MNLPVFLAQVDFTSPAARHAKGLSYFQRLRNSLFLLQQKQLKHPRRPDIALPLAGHRDSRKSESCFG